MGLHWPSSGVGQQLPLHHVAWSSSIIPSLADGCVLHEGSHSKPCGLAPLILRARVICSGLKVPSKGRAGHSAGHSITPHGAAGGARGCGSLMDQTQRPLFMPAPTISPHLPCAAPLPLSSLPAGCAQQMSRRAAARLPSDMTSGPCAVWSRGACFPLQGNP